ncbi:hypothetical protein Tsubulata_025334 [Turnera subulata]|uniref:Calcium uniporter protein C-terminal domain-containing protein n=1 Tax=Turnera subulata TaxID=218843 RepID=A0A9Q0FE41_9ROSI|nr:hypothetical protein Tsubulata_025334 [Turnera subulata]
MPTTPPQLQSLLPHYNNYNGFIGRRTQEAQQQQQQQQQPGLLWTPRAVSLFSTATSTTTSSSSSASSSPPPTGGDDVSSAAAAANQQQQQHTTTNNNNNLNETLTCGEAKRLMRLVNVEALKMKLTQGAAATGSGGGPTITKEVIPYTQLLETCQSMGIARSYDEAVAFARVLDEAGVLLLFRDKVYLHPDKVVDLIRRAVPLALTPEDDPLRDELKRLVEKKEKIDVLAHKKVRRILWFGLGLAVVQVGLFFRLTFWEFSWDVMEPIAFFVTATSIVVGYAYFLFTARDPTYQDLMKRLFLSKQRKLFKKHNFDVERYKELQRKCKSPLDCNASIKNRVGLDVDLEDALHKD